MDTDKMDMMISVSLEMIENLLINGLETTQWCKCPNYSSRTVPSLVRDDKFVDCYDYVEFLETGEIKNLRLNLAKCKLGLRKMAEQHPHHFADAISERDDAVTASVFLQLILLGEVMYG